MSRRLSRHGLEKYRCRRSA